MGNDILKGEFSTDEIVYNNNLWKLKIEGQKDFTGTIDDKILDWKFLNDINIMNTNISVDPSPEVIGRELDEADVCGVYLMSGYENYNNAFGNGPGGEDICTETD